MPGCTNYYPMNTESRDRIAEILVSIRDGRPIGRVDMDMSKTHQGRVEDMLEATLCKEPEADAGRLQELLNEFTEESVSFEPWIEEWLGSTDEDDMINVIHDAYLQLV